jgi:hypothetical protein
LAFIFAMRMMAKSRPVKAEACVAIGILLIVNLIVMLRYVRSARQDYIAETVESGGPELAAYVAAYILPFAVVGDAANWDVAAYAAVLFCIGIVSVRGDALHLNPLLAVAGYRLYTITTPMKRRWLVMSRDRIQEKDILQARTLVQRLVIVTRNVSADERNGTV